MQRCASNGALCIRWSRFVQCHGLMEHMREMKVWQRKIIDWKPAAGEKKEKHMEASASACMKSRAASCVSHSISLTLAWATKEEGGGPGHQVSYSDQATSSNCLGPRPAGALIHDHSQQRQGVMQLMTTHQLPHLGALWSRKCPTYQQVTQKYMTQPSQYILHMWGAELKGLKSIYWWIPEHSSVLISSCPFQHCVKTPPKSKVHCCMCCEWPGAS